ncbi:TetR/AcrR family transcriptional regulator [Thioclava kandeliae]|uniref:TetR/AcrR family transcriptional regulator n=1 Tax=Thioclava kandeliae TaxID=3070818 RepID=A0ABV1SJ42_9RHOB
MTQTPPPAGRPRNRDTGPALLAAAHRLVAQHGYEAVSISQIIEEAGVSRQSLYRRWPTKADLVLDSFHAMSAPLPPLDPHCSGRETLELFLTQIFHNLADMGSALTALIAAAQTDLQFRAHFVQSFVKPREELMLEILRHARTRGEIGGGSDLQILSDMIHGAFWYRVLNGDPLDEQVVTRLVATVFASATSG